MSVQVHPIVFAGDTCWKQPVLERGEMDSIDEMDEVRQSAEQRLGIKLSSTLGLSSGLHPSIARFGKQFWYVLQTRA